MDFRVVLSKIVTFIYRSRQIGVYDHDDLLRTILEKVKIETSQQPQLLNNSISNLKTYSLELLEIKESIPIEYLKQRLTIVLDKDPNLLKAILDAVEVTLEESAIKRTLTSLVKLLSNYYKESNVIELVSKAAYDLKFNRSKITNINDYVRDLMTQLEPLSLNMTKIKDPALINEVDFEVQDNLRNAFEEVKNINNNLAIFKTGWQGLNTMLQGGVRRGEFVTIGALQHKYKTGFSLSLFMQIAMHNKPFAVPANKKPLLLRISFEDSIVNNLQFMYIYLRSHEDKNFNIKEIDSISNEKLSSYIVEKLTSNGFYIKLLRVDPSQWTYLNVINKIIELEANGYEVQLLMLDYITLLPTTGCVTGPIGSDRKDLIRRIRNFCSSKNITVITPIQLSSEAKQLIRNGVPEHQFVNEIAEKGYYDGSRSIDQDLDLELFIHLFNHNKKKILSVRRGKHRVPTVIDELDKYMMLPFPGLNIPIQEDINAEDSSFKVLPRNVANSNILSEIL